MNDILGFLKEKEKQKKTFKDFLLDIFDVISFLVFVGGIVLIVRLFVFNPFTVVGESMEPTFHPKDFIIVDKITPKVGEFKRGDMVVFVPPKKEINYIKRIIGMPGETVKLKDGEVFICKDDNQGKQCRKLDEKYLPEGIDTKAKCDVSEFEVTSGSYFVMGDNREHSTDSRCCFGISCYSGSNALIPKDYILGKVYMKLYPDIKKY